MHGKSIISKMIQHIDCRSCVENIQKGRSGHAGRMLTLSNEWTFDIKRRGSVIELRFMMKMVGVAKQRKRVVLRRRPVINDEGHSDGFIPTVDTESEDNADRAQSEENSVLTEREESSEDIPPPVRRVSPRLQRPRPVFEVEQASCQKELNFRLTI